MSHAKETLQQIRRLDNLIACQLSEAARIEEMLTKITPVLTDDVSFGGGNHDRIGNGVARLVDLREKINRSIDEYADTKAEIMKAMRRMQNPDYVNVLYLRYFLYKTWEEIAAEMTYSYRGICYMHGRALQEFEKVMNVKEKKKNEAD